MLILVNKLRNDLARMQIEKDEMNQLIENENQLIKKHEKTLYQDIPNELLSLESHLKTLNMEIDDIEYELKKTKSEIAIREIEVDEK